jgi:hypothetical protein
MIASPTGLPRSSLADLRALANLTVEATKGLADVVEEMHGTIAHRPGVLGTPVRGGTNGITGLVYRSVRGVATLVGVGADELLSRLAPLARDAETSPTRDALLAALNGVLGDTLEATGNPLAISMRLHASRRGDPPVVPGSRLVVLVHGLCRNDRQWTRRGHDHGAALARDAGYTPLYLRYNSGLHVWQNGRDFAEAMEKLVSAWPVPLEELSILAHSMGGLVARSAHHQATAAGHEWPKRLKAIVFLGTPHLGAPLERGGHWLNLLLGVSPYTAPLARLGRIRSAGITDLRHGSLLPDDGHVPLPRGVRCAAIAATLGERPGALASSFIGDGIVPLASALGRHADPRRALAFPAPHVFVANGASHLDLLSRREVYGKVRAFLAGETFRNAD